MPGENYESRLMPCMDYEIPGDTPLAAFRVRDYGTVRLYCERFRLHMAPNPAASEDGHFANYPPTRNDWYNFLACTFYTFNAEDFLNVDPGNFGRQRGNTRSGTNSVSIANVSSGRFVTGWAGQRQNSSEWSGCVQGLPLLWS